MKTISLPHVVLSCLLLLSLPLPSSNAAKSASCSFELDPSTLKVEWTAFKTTQKVAVNGAFSDVKLSGTPAKGSAFPAFLGQHRAEIQLADSSRIKTGNPTRDGTLFDHFFSLFKKTPIIEGSLKGVKGGESEGSFALHLTMNQKTRDVPMKFTRDAQGNFAATGTLELNEFALQDAFASLHKACETLHKGTDGVSKTWSEVEIRLSAKISGNCGP